MRMPLHVRILIGLAFGAITGIVCHVFFSDLPQLTWVVENIANPIGQAFLRLLFMLVIPLVVSALILGVSELGDVRRLGKIGLKTFIYTVVVSSIAVFIGLTLVNIVQLGKGLPEHLQAQLLEQAAEGNMLALMVFALFFGMAMAVVPREKTRGLTDTLEGIFAVSIKLTN